MKIGSLNLFGNWNSNVYMYHVITFEDRKKSNTEYCIIKEQISTSRLISVVLSFIFYYPPYIGVAMQTSDQMHSPT